jgi:hypothetical protein
MRRFTLQPRKSSRLDYSNHKTLRLGAIPLQDELLFLSPILNQNDSGPDNDCTAFASVACRTNVTHVQYDPAEQWLYETMEGATDAGTDLETALKTGKQMGFCPLGGKIAQDRAQAYLWVTPHDGLDMFDSIKTAVQQAQRPILAGVNWMQDWDFTPVIQSQGYTPLGGHCIKIAGWDRAHPNCLAIQNSWGDSMGDHGVWYFSRAVVNKVFGSYGIGYWSDDPNLNVIRLGFFAAILQNIVAIFQLLIRQKEQPITPIDEVIPAPAVPVQPVSPVYPTPVAPQPVAPHVSLIPTWAAGIRKAEGFVPGSRSFRNHNAGNLRATNYTMSLGAVGKDSDNFCIFPTDQSGMKALCAFLTAAAKNELKPYHEVDLATFTKIYAQPQSHIYLDIVVTELQRPSSIKISSLL